ncbi:hypothetical protein D049_4444B, partial [Vibrio parahaemolyticus VPTS-2010]
TCTIQSKPPATCIAAIAVITDMMIKITSTGMYAWLVGTPKIKDNAMTPAPPAKPMPIPPILAPK